MALQIGIVGLPNVGKSTLFNALTKSQAAAAANFPFCTIDPNVGIVNVPDERLDKIAELVKPQKTLHSATEFVDIAGLVKGASQGEGLGNQFLAHIRECAAIALVLRFFADPNVHHVHGKVDPKVDHEVIEAELILADMQTLEKALQRAEKDKKGGDKTAALKFTLCEKLKKNLESGEKANLTPLTDDERPLMKELQLLTAKPFLFLANVAEKDLANFDLAAAKDLAGITTGENL